MTAHLLVHQNYATPVYMPVRLHTFHEEWIVKGKQMALKPQVAAKTEDTELLPGRRLAKLQEQLLPSSKAWIQQSSAICKEPQQG